MPIIAITTWPTWSGETKRTLLERITHVTHVTTGAPLDKIVVLVNEVQQNCWMEGGTLGSSPSFATDSRRRTYPDQTGPAAETGTKPC